VLQREVRDERELPFEGRNRVRKHQRRKRNQLDVVSAENHLLLQQNPHQNSEKNFRVEKPNDFTENPAKKILVAFRHENLFRQK
jgi:hypothetical protein